MLKSIRKLTSRFKDSFESKPLELIESLLLLVVASGGFLIAVADVLGRPKVLSEHLAEVTLGLVGLLGLHFCVERFTVMHRVESELEFLGWIPKRIPPGIKASVRTFIESHCKLEELKTHAQHDNKQFPKIVDSFLKKHEVQLQELSVGKLDVSSDETAIVNQELLTCYKNRFDAVSDDDLDYWAGMSPDALAYFNVHREFIRRHTTIVTRIFILPRSEMREKLNLIKVLKEQDDAKIGWGVAIQEDLPLEVKRQNKDFALYDRDKAVSIFTGKKHNRAFHTIFATNENKTKIDVYKKLYRDLVSECCLVNQKFVEAYAGALEPGELAEVEEHGKKNNKDWNIRFKQPDTMFPLIVNSANEVQDKVDLLVRVMD